jgi:hypothetical protein
MAGDLFKNGGDTFLKYSQVDAMDSVIFDLSRVDSTANKISFPVYFLSDDTVNALDFSFKYNENDFVYDSITDLSNTLQYFSYYNPFDSTLRFTSNSFQQYNNNTDIVKITFSKIFGELCIDDFRSVKVYLNGDMCSYRIKDCLHLSARAILKSENGLTIKNDNHNHILRIIIPENANCSLISMDGRTLFKTFINRNESFDIPTSIYENGIYILNLQSPGISFTKKIAIQH